MNSIRKLIGLMTAVMLAAFAGSAMAAGSIKTFTATAQSGLSTTAGHTTIKITITNQSPPPGLSAGNSIKLIAPTNGAFKFDGYTTPGTVLEKDATGTYVIINNFPGVNRGTSKDFFVGVTAVAPGCAGGSVGVMMNTGNSFNGDVFYDANNPTSQTVQAGWSACLTLAGTVTCGGPPINASIAGATYNDPGYALVTVSDKYKDGTSCGTTSFTYNIVNGLLVDNKLVVVFPEATATKIAFTADINSKPLPLVDGYASLRPKVAWVQNLDGSWQYYPARTCACSSALSSCMPTGPVSTDPYDTDPNSLTDDVRVCAADYMWVNAGAGFARYFATIIGTGNDPAMGWSD